MLSWVVTFLIVALVAGILGFGGIAGASIEMAKIVLQYGRDPALKKLARDIIKAQDKEIAFMKAWQGKNAKP